MEHDLDQQNDISLAPEKISLTLEAHIITLSLITMI